jgi:uridine kinase
MKLKNDLIKKNNQYQLADSKYKNTRFDKDSMLDNSLIKRELKKIIAKEKLTIIQEKIKKENFDENIKFN